jgi:hypothetical protein
MQRKPCAALHGDEWLRYAERTPRFIPFMCRGKMLRGA